ncbi:MULTISPECIES: sugar O-acetyltransferase [Paenibacillus]|nr:MULTISPECIES: sugar O-acetyltransferase [Paenibacillus]OAX48512.1 putative acetyltransferase [Paenibacillus sp. AD87]WDQ31040.1 sugar O-acetyltransferase [Paenibacillus marchantiae]SDK42763.1 Acetyltransferase (isoleucine patch superfamily) [Paenibacillus sp. OK060]SHN59380.1 Hexapeptide repeat of succinyl-transferase [Paenibacillus sp. ov031]
MKPKDILERDKNGELISLNDPEYYKIHDLIVEAQKITMQLNNSYHEAKEVRGLFSKLTGVEVDESFGLLPPFYTDFGKNIRVGRNVFINHACTFMDRGGITLEDNVLIGPKVNLITINHPLEPAERRSTISTPIVIKKNAWLGAGTMIMPGVTIGENSIVAAGAVVTKDVPPNTIAAGVPAKIIKNLE